ncbi:coiled-coil domain-containing protein 7-like [Mastomys coucha]|uniref:coiled-coil domain-containing protein 7-like n=1 Tax=Mastomys coucha TaxID=35658 RepID=UPI001261657F|nr:coiled-coil domain-containing protein 7-like [Mastomys coucha]
MKQAKHPSTFSMKLTSVPVLPYKKRLLTPSPKPREKHDAKSTPDKNEPMVLRSPPTGESMVRFALPIPLTKTKEIISSFDIVRRVNTNLKTIVSNLEDTYGTDNDGGKKKAEKLQAEDLSVGNDVKSFLLCCSEFTSQLEEAVKEECNVLESLYKWFQRQVNEMEEISKGQNILEAEIPADGKSASLNIVQIAKLARKFEDIKIRLKDRKAAIQAKQEDKAMLAESLKQYGLLEKQIEEFIKSHSTLESEVETESASGQPSGSPAIPGPEDQNQQDLHDMEQQQNIQEEFLWGSSFDSVAEDIGLETDQWVTAMNICK